MSPATAFAAEPAAEPADLAFFAEAMRARTGVMLPETKRALIYRRLAPRLRELGLVSFAAYRARLADQADPEWDVVIGALTTNHSRFFREIHHFKLLDRHLDKLMKSRDKRIRLWSAACAGGQEPYSMAILLLRALAERRDLDARVLATDIDASALETAATGIYPPEDVGRLPRFARAYLRSGADGRFTLTDAPRGLVTFKRHNLIGDVWPMKGPFDAIFCRNMLIYLSAADQAKVVRKLVDLLRPGGILCLGHSETVRGSLPIERVETASAYVRI
jgi:chemotaxis protein methyltransferase CheR